jgi:proteasome activator subunit 4
LNADAALADWQRHHHEQWGKRYQAKDVVIDWHVPTQTEIDFAIELLQDLVLPSLATLEGLLQEASEGDGNRSKTWTNDFCRVRSIS